MEQCRQPRLRFFPVRTENADMVRYDFPRPPENTHRDLEIEKIGHGCGLAFGVETGGGTILVPTSTAPRFLRLLRNGDLLE